MSTATRAMPKAARPYTVPQIAELLSVGKLKVLGWIRSGELRAWNASATRDSRKPRFLVEQTDFEQFKLSRQPIPPAPTSTRRRQTAASGVRKFF